MARTGSFQRFELERRIEDAIALLNLIEEAIGILDLMDGDPDVEDGHDDEPTLGADNDHEDRSQELWAKATRLDECEAEDEHGGDILDEPHDDDDELEENGDEQDCCLSEDEWHPLEPGIEFDGAGAIMAGELLRRAKTRREPYSEIIGTRHHRLQDGSVFTTLVPR